jgi:regulator of RNase E activity RraA
MSLVMLAVAICPGVSEAELLTLSREAMIELTAEWQGERFPDGRPKVPDGILERMKEVAIEEAWGVCRRAQYHYLFEGNWINVHPDRVVVGRAVTGTFLPHRPDLDNYIRKVGKEQGRSQSGGLNAWVIDTLVEGDVIVIDLFGKIDEGTYAGGNLANSINAKTGGTGMVVDGGVRDLAQIYDIDGFNAFIRDAHPSAIAGATLSGINVPIRIGSATCIPGDVVLGTREGVFFIPPHLAEQVVDRAERIRLRDTFGFQRLREGKYSPGEIDSRWTDEMEADFTNWLRENIDDLPVPRTTVEEYLREREKQ